MKAAFALSALWLISVALAIPHPQLPGATSVPVSPASGAQVVPKVGASGWNCKTEEICRSACDSGEFYDSGDTLRCE
ncbi:hypothetical protein PENSUB_12341 [Penicillium subrubescens]|uniref:Apple domain-containing protein n=1 Tax=Penicillium subrubescens TaxID=1316194 RepID=A0A1Q5SZ51_9EURO|nr:hypothetical protein PENSUB_12341 [Penicillium subrubescens]